MHKTYEDVTGRYRGEQDWQTIGVIHKWTCDSCGDYIYTSSSWPPAGWVDVKFTVVNEDRDGEKESSTVRFPDLCPRCAVKHSISDLAMIGFTSDD